MYSFSSMAGNTVIHAPSSWGRNATIWWHRAYQEDSDDEISPVDAHFELSHQILRGSIPSFICNNHVFSSKFIDEYQNNLCVQ